MFRSIFVGTGPSSYEKKNLPGRGLTKVQKHWARAFAARARNARAVQYHWPARDVRIHYACRLGDLVYYFMVRELRACAADNAV